MQNWIKSFRVAGWVVILLMVIAMLYAGVMALTLYSDISV